MGLGCVCERISPLALRRADIEARIRATPRIKTSLAVVVESRLHGATLFRCRDCGQPWQSARHPIFGGAEYVFHVPEIAPEAWLSEPYLQPAALLAYAEAKRWLAQTRQFGIRPVAPGGRLFFLSPESLDEERARRRGGSVALHEALAQGRHAQHLEPKRSAC